MGDRKIDDETVKLYIGGIGADWSSERVSEILSKHGKIKRVDIVKNFAFAFVSNQQTADTVIKEVSGKTFDGCRIVVQISKNKQNLVNVDTDVCFECGKPGHWAKECSLRQQRMGRRDDGPRGDSRYSDRYASHGRDRDPYPRDPYARDLYTRDPYARDPYTRDPYARDPYARDYGRDVYARSSYGSYEYDRYEAARAVAASYRERSPTSAYAAYRRAVSPPPTRSAYAASDPYAAARERLAYGRSPDPYADSARRLPVDPYDTARRALDAVRRADPYGTSASRTADPYDTPRERYSSELSSTQKRYTDSAAYPARQ